MILQSFSQCDHLIDFDSATGSIKEWISKSSDPTRVFEPPIGEFEFLGGKLICLLRVGKELALRIGDKQFSLLDYRMTSNHSGEDIDGRCLCVSNDRGDVLCEVRYTVENQDELRKWDTTPFVEEEDFDFGLFIANVANDPARQSRLYRWTNS